MDLLIQIYRGVADNEGAGDIEPCGVSSVNIALALIVLGLATEIS